MLINVLFSCKEMVIVMSMGALRNLGGVGVVDAPYDISFEISVVLAVRYDFHEKIMCDLFSLLFCRVFMFYLDYYIVFLSIYGFRLYFWYLPKKNSNIYFTHSLVVYHWLFVIARENVNSDGIHQCQVRLK